MLDWEIKELMLSSLTKYETAKQDMIVAEETIMELMGEVLTLAATDSEVYKKTQQFLYRLNEEYGIIY